jgi:hypothetical protein
MPHYSLGRLTSDSTLVCPHDALKPIAIYKDVMMWGILYPKSHLSISDRKRPRFDFVISPIPFRLWPLTGRLIVNVTHRRGAFRRIAEVLAKQPASILVSEGARSGHRYATWNLIISCDDIDPEKLTGYTTQLKAYPAVVDRLHGIKKALEEECGDILHSEISSDPSLKEPVRVSAHNSMAYFYMLCQQPREALAFEGINQDWLFYNPFHLRCTDGVTLVPAPRDGLFRSIVRHLDAKLKKIIPSHVFISSSAFDMNMRAVLIPQEREKRFFGVTVRFNRDGLPPTSCGFIDHVLSALKEDFSIWGLSNVSYMYARESEVGVTNVIAYDKTDLQGIRSNHDREHMIKEKVNLTTLSSVMPAVTGVTVDCYPLDTLQANVSREPSVPIVATRSSKVFDVFISYSSHNEAEALKLESLLQEGGLRVFRDQKDLALGQLFSDELRKSMLQSKEILILCSKRSLGSDWVKKELGAAWIMNIPVTPVLLNLEWEELPGELKAIKGCSYTDAIEQGTKWIFFQHFERRNRESS